MLQLRVTSLTSPTHTMIIDSTGYTLVYTTNKSLELRNKIGTIGKCPIIGYYRIGIY